MIEALLFLFTGIIGVVTLTLLIRFYNSNPFCNFFLILIICVLSFRFLVHGSYSLGIQQILKPDSGIYSLLYLLIVPCFYLYYKYLLFPNIRYSIIDLKHLVFIVFIFLINSIESLDNSVLFYFGSITNVFYIGLYIVFYIIMIFQLLRKNIWCKKGLLLDDKHIRLVKNWTLYLFVINVISSAVLLISFYYEIHKGDAPSGKSMAIFMLFFWLFVFFKILTSPEILFGLPILNRTLLKFNEPLKENKKVLATENTSWILETALKKSNQDIRLQENIRANIDSYITEVDKLSTEKFVFRNPKASQSDLAEMLGVPTSHIIYLFKYHSKISFSEYRMNSRIQDAITRINEGFLNSETFESLAYSTGFSSYNPFFIAFKKITKYAPQDYLKVYKA